MRETGGDKSLHRRNNPMGEDEKQGKDHFKEGRKHFEKGGRKVLEQGLEKGREQRKKLDYYKENRSDLIKNFSRRLGNPKKPASAGLIVLLPILAVLIVVDWLFDKIEQMPGGDIFNISNLIYINETVNYYLNQSFKLAMFLLIGALIVTGAGRFVKTQKGFKMEKWLDKAFNRIPFLGTIYNLTKVTTETVLGGAEDLSKPVKVEQGGFRLNAFKTGNRTEDGREIVFLPTAPNITSGLVLELEEDQIQETDETAEEALTRILSAGFGAENSNREENNREEENSEQD